MYWRKPQYSTINVPPLDNSSMDGYAVRCADVAAMGSVLAGQPAHSRRQAWASRCSPVRSARIFTGAPVPPGADAIVMQEYVSFADGKATFNELPKPGEWIRKAGEDISTGGEVLSRGGTQLRPQETGLGCFGRSG